MVLYYIYFIGWINELSAPYVLANAFKDLAAIGL